MLGNGKTAILKQGRGLLERGGPFTPTESRALAACWPLVRGAELKDYTAVLLARAARAHHVEPAAEKRKQDPTPFDDEIRRREPEVEALAERYRAANAELFEAREIELAVVGGFASARFGIADLVLPSRKASTAEQEAARDRARTAEGDLLAADDALAIARGRLNNLRQRADRWRYENTDRGTP